MSLLDEVTDLVTKEDKAEQAKEAARRAAQKKRDDALAAMTHAFADGRVVQVRPKDLANFQTAIGRGKSRKWVLANNTVATMNPSELQEAMQSGIKQGEIIWDQYIEEIS